MLERRCLLERRASGDAVVTSARTPRAKSVELHQSTMTADGVMQMRKVEGAIPIEAGESLVLKPGGTHLMLLGLEDALKAGEQLILTLEFSNAGSVDVLADIVGYYTDHNHDDRYYTKAEIDPLGVAARDPEPAVRVLFVRRRLVEEPELRERNFGVAGSGMAALAETFQPQGYNLGWNLGRIAGAGIVDHVHEHVVPRWAGDTNFMPVLADVKVLPEHLLATRDRLREAWATR